MIQLSGPFDGDAKGTREWFGADVFLSLSVRIEVI